MPLPDPAPAAAAPNELAVLLNRATLRLGPDVSTRTLQRDRLVAKFQPGRRYLVLSPAQWELLQEFGTGRTATAALCDIIAAQRCPSLREYYELVVKAARAG